MHRPSRRVVGPRTAGFSAIAAIWTMLLAHYLVGRLAGAGLTRELVVYAAAASLSGLVFASTFVFLDNYMAAPTRPWGRIGRIAAAVGAVTLVHAAFDVPLQIMIEGPLKYSAPHMLALNFMYYFWVHATAAGLVALLRLTDELHRSEQRASHLVADNARAQVSALRLQINPHFLFNTLNAVSSLILTARPREAEEILGRLAALLRLSLSADPGQLCRFEHELALAECYTDVEQARFGERLKVTYRVDPAAMTALVPCFLLQPLLEAFVAQAMESTRGTLNMEVLAGRDLSAIRMEISHDGNMDVAAPSLEALRERLIHAYQGRAQWEANSGERGLRLSLVLPLAA